MTSFATDPSADGDGVTVYDLDPRCVTDAMETDECYHVTVNGVVDYGVFVDVSEEVSGLVHESNLLGSYEVGDKLIVELVEERENGDLSFRERRPADYQTEVVPYGQATTVEDLDGGVGETVNLDGIVLGINQTGGPTVFKIGDGTGVVPCAAFEDAGVRAYPEIEIDDVVRISGRVEARDDGLQIEAESLSRLGGTQAAATRERVADATAALAAPEDVDPLVEWEAFEPLRAELTEVARLLRRTVLAGRPIRMRHHADGDGLCASVPLELALERFVDRTHRDGDAAQHLLKRLPSKAPFYEMEDVTRDLNFALENRSRHGQKLPLLVMLDNGSTEEDTPAYENLAHYDIPVVVVDHHHPDPEAVEDLLEAHVNPYLHGEDYRITTGMMCVELARMIAPSLTEDLEHVPAVAGLSDRSEAEVMDEFLDLAGEKGYDSDQLRDIGEALDYATHWLRYDDGGPLVTDALDLDCDDPDRHERLVVFLAERSERAIQRQVESATPHLEHEHLDNGAHLYRLDVENDARRFTYPAPGKTTGAVHDRKVEETGEPVITIGYGPDFAVLRSDGVRLDIPEMVAQLREELPGAGVSGGGHLVVGSIKFVKGRREPVLDALVEKMAEAELDEGLHSSASVPHGPE